MSGNPRPSRTGHRRRPPIPGESPRTEKNDARPLPLSSKSPRIGSHSFGATLDCDRTMAGFVHSVQRDCPRARQTHQNCRKPGLRPHRNEEAFQFDRLLPAKPADPCRELNRVHLGKIPRQWPPSAPGTADRGWLAAHRPHGQPSPERPAWRARRQSEAVPGSLSLPSRNESWESDRKGKGEHPAVTRPQRPAQPEAMILQHSIDGDRWR